jgi:hypothetical protein
MSYGAHAWCIRVRHATEQTVLIPRARNPRKAASPQAHLRHAEGIVIVSD